MAEWVICPSCGLKHSRRPDGICPRCRNNVNETQPPPSPSTSETHQAVPPPSAFESKTFSPSATALVQQANLCESCGASVPTRYVELHQNIGAILFRFHRSVKGHLCRQCVSKHFRELTLVTLFAGWWGIISFFVTPFILLNNIIQYLSSRSLDKAPLGPTAPQVPTGGIPFVAHGPVSPTPQMTRASGPPRQGLAIASLILGIVSLLSFGIVGVGALAGIVFGIMALVKAHREPSVYGGKVMAVVGVGSSVLSLLFLGALLFVVPTLLEKSSKEAEPGQLEFQNANATINAFGGKAAFGNTPEAEELAQRFSKVLSAVDSISFTGGRREGAPSLTEDQFLTYAELRHDRVCFLVHVPQLKNYQGEVRDTLLDLSWMCAREATAELRKQRDLELAVGLRGVLLYGGMAIGMGNDEEPSIRESAAEIDRKKLYRFFTDIRGE